MLKSVLAACAATSLTLLAAAPAFATGKVYGDYGTYQPQPSHRGHHRSSSCDADVAVGTGLGAIVGGVIGNQFGKGSGRTAATIGGVILGGIAGNAIAKDTCKDDHHDAYYYNNTYYDAFDSDDEGREYEWRNPYTNNYGYVTAGDYYDDGYQGYEGPCREFSQRVFIDGYPETAYGVACRQPDGSWRIVSGN